MLFLFPAVNRLNPVPPPFHSAYDAQGGRKRGVHILEGKLYLCLRDGIAEVSAESMRMSLTPFSGAEVLCAGREFLFASDDRGAIWRLDRRSMLERGMSCGGPGICDLCLSPDGMRLFALLGEGDSVLLSDAHSGRPLALNCCGCNPQNLSFCGKTLAASGGESSCVLLYSADALQCVAEIPMPGPVCCVLLCRHALFALCLTPEWNTLLVLRRREKQNTIHLSGVPGCLCLHNNRLLAATQGRLYTFCADSGRLLGVCCAPGRASRLFAAGDKLFLLDPLSECAFVSGSAGAWKTICGGVRHMCII